MFALAIIYDKQYRFCFYSRSAYVCSNILPLISVSLACVFIVTEGLRYGRGIDQIGNYGPFYLHCQTPDLWFQDMEQVFVWINQIVYKIDVTIGVLPFGLIFVAFAIIFWLCLWTLYKNYKPVTKFFLLFAILATNYITEWTIRQGVSMSFSLIVIYCLNNKKIKLSVLFAILSISIHYGNVISILLLYTCYIFLNKKPLPIKITIPLFIFLSLFFTKLLPYISDKISLLNLSFMGGNFQAYINNSSENFGTDAIQEEWKRGAIQQFLTSSFYCGIIIIGYYYHKIFTSKNYAYIYNVFVIGILVVEPFHQMGNIARVFLLASVLWFIPVSLAIYKWNIIRSKIIVRLSGFFIFVYLFLYYGRYVLLNPTATYVWNI